MKPLILSFFVVLLGYSLFFDKEKESKLHEHEHTMLSQPKVVKTEHKSDSIELYAKKTNFNILKLVKNDSFFN